MTKPSGVVLLDVAGLAERGLLIESGWQTLRACVVDPSATDEQLREMRWAFFAGANHLLKTFALAFNETDQAEVTEPDIAVVQSARAELERFVAEVERLTGEAEAEAEASSSWPTCPECNAAPWCQAHRVCSRDRLDALSRHDA